MLKRARIGTIFGLILTIGCLAFMSPVAAHPLEKAYEGFWTAEISGNKLTEFCPRDWQPSQFDQCNAYMVGVIEGLSLGLVVCPSGDTKARQLTMIAHQAIWADPKRWNLPAPLLIAQSLAPLYPCTGNG